MAKKILKENYIYIIVILSIIVILTIIMKSPLHAKIMAFDNVVINFIKSIHEEHLTALFKVLTYFGDFYIPFLTIIVLCANFVFLFIEFCYQSEKWDFKFLFCMYIIM